MSLLSKYANGALTIMDWLGDGGVPVQVKLAQQRADVCLACDHNKRSLPMAVLIRATSESAKALIAIKNQEQLRVNGEKRLGQCEQCECWMSLKIWTPIEHLAQYAGDEPMPPHCWQRIELENL